MSDFAGINSRADATEVDDDPSESLPRLGQTYVQTFNTPTPALTDVSAMIIDDVRQKASPALELIGDDGND